MEIKDFIAKMADQFDARNEDEVFDADTQFRKVSSWSSLTALSIMSMIDDEYDIVVSGDDIVKSLTVRDLFNVVNSKKQI